MGEIGVAFVGRVDELAMLERLLVDASAGRPRVVLVSGDAGIGKTRFVHEVVGRAQERGCLTLLGACQEDVAIPYLPIAAALRPLVDFETIAATPSPGGDGGLWTDLDEHDALRLYLGVTAAVLRATDDRCVVLVVEDVHWADDATADLLVHLVTSAVHEAADRHLRLLVVLTSRADWVTGGIPAPLDRLGRHPDSVALPLRPLTSSDVLVFVSSMAGARPTPTVVDELLDATGGNAFLLRSVVTRHVATGRLAARFGALELEAGGRLVAPADLDAEIRLRLDRVDAETLVALTQAALLGDDVLLDELRAVHHQTGGDDTERATARAVECDVLVVDDDRYRFVHPQIRHVLAQRPTTSQRREIHRQIAAALVHHYGGDATAHALEIAHHLERAGVPDDPNDAVEWAMRAGAQAWTAGAWTRAKEAYDAALRWDAGAGAEERNERQLRGAIAAYMAHDPSSADRLREAAATARERGDIHRWADAVLLLARFAAEDTGGTLGQPAKTSELEELLDALGSDEPALRVRVLATLSEAVAIAMQLERAEQYEHEAERTLAESAERDAGAILRLSLAIGNRAFRVLRFEQARTQFKRASRVEDSARQPDLAMSAQTRVGLIDIATGNLAAAERALDHVRTDRFHAVARERQLATAALATAAAARGELGHAERLAADAIALYQLHEYVFTPGIAYPVLSLSRALRGDLDGARSAVDEWSEEGARGTWRYRALIDAWADGADGVDERVVSRQWRLPAGIDILTLDLACIHIELARVLGRVDAIEPALAMLEEAHERGCSFTIGWTWSLARAIGEGWLLLDKPDEASRWFATAQRACRRAGAKIEEGRSCLGLARCAVLAGQLTDALALARRAAVALDEVGALDLARQARAICRETGADASIVRPTLRAILVTDLGGSTEINVRGGDQAYVQVLAEHDRVIRRRLAEHGGVEFKHTGDGLCAWFASAADAVYCALGIRDDLERLTAVQPEVRLAVRAGISAGEPVDTGNDLFGLAVVVAARVCALASPGQVYVAEEVTQLTRGKPLVFHEVGPVQLKGLPDTTTVFEALRL